MTMAEVQALCERTGIQDTDINGDEIAGWVLSESALQKLDAIAADPEEAARWRTAIARAFAPVPKLSSEDANRAMAIAGEIRDLLVSHPGEARDICRCVVEAAQSALVQRFGYSDNDVMQVLVDAAMRSYSERRDAGKLH